MPPPETAHTDRLFFLGFFGFGTAVDLTGLTGLTGLLLRSPKSFAPTEGHVAT